MDTVLREIRHGQNVFLGKRQLEVLNEPNVTVADCDEFVTILHKRSRSFCENGDQNVAEARANLVKATRLRNLEPDPRKTVQAVSELAAQVGVAIVPQDGTWLDGDVPVALPAVQQEAQDNPQPTILQRLGEIEQLLGDDAPPPPGLPDEALNLRQLIVRCLAVSRESLTVAQESLRSIRSMEAKRDNVAIRASNAVLGGDEFLTPPRIDAGALAGTVPPGLPDLTRASITGLTLQRAVALLGHYGIAPPGQVTVADARLRVCRLYGV